MAEHSTVNRRVAGSSPAWGVFLNKKQALCLFFFISKVFCGTRTVGSSGFADGRHEVSPNSEQIEPAKAKPPGETL